MIWGEKTLFLVQHPVLAFWLEIFFVFVIRKKWGPMVPPDPPVKFHCTCGGDSMVICIPPIIGSLEKSKKSRFFREDDEGMFTLEVQRLFFEWFFRKDYCFSRDLQSTIQGDYSFYGLWLPGFRFFLGGATWRIIPGLGYVVNWPMVMLVSPQLWDPFQIAFLWLINGGDPNYLVHAA